MSDPDLPWNQPLNPSPSATRRLGTGGTDQQESTTTGDLPLSPPDHVETGRNTEEKEAITDGETTDWGEVTTRSILELKAESEGRLQQARGTRRQLTQATNTMRTSLSHVESQLDGSKPRHHFDLEKLRHEHAVLEETHRLLDKEIFCQNEHTKACRRLLRGSEKMRDNLAKFISKLERLDDIYTSVGVDDVDDRLQVRQDSDLEIPQTSEITRRKRRRLA